MILSTDGGTVKCIQSFDHKTRFIWRHKRRWEYSI